ncbi:hypothetical protein [Acidithiobacillus ferrooxidans]|nr:hypothetical protein [Acidithiobacillus ferrooxidans]
MRNKADMDVRAEKMAQMFKSGAAMARIGEAFGLTRSRVQQILAAQGLTRRDGGPMLAHAEKARQRAEKAALKVEHLAALREAALDDPLVKQWRDHAAKLREWATLLPLESARDLCAKAALRAERLEHRAVRRAEELYAKATRRPKARACRLQGCRRQGCRLQGPEDALLKKRAQQEAKLRAWSEQVLGIPLEEARDLCQMPDSPGTRRGRPSVGDSIPCKKYVAGRTQAVMKYGAYLSFRDWWRVWQESGHFSAVTGPGAGWCLIKKDYALPWGADNAQIVPHGAWSKAGGGFGVPRAMRVGTSVRRDGYRLHQ